MSVPLAKVEVKSEPLDVVLRADSEEIPAPAGWEDDQDCEQMEIASLEEECMDVDDGLGSVFRDAGELAASVVGGLFIRPYRR